MSQEREGKNEKNNHCDIQTLSASEIESSRFKFNLSRRPICRVTSFQTGTRSCTFYLLNPTKILLAKNCPMTYSSRIRILQPHKSKSGTGYKTLFKPRATPQIFRRIAMRNLGSLFKSLVVIYQKLTWGRHTERDIEQSTAIIITLKTSH